MQISYIGMQTQEVGIKSHVKVTMRSDAEMLEEVMVVAFGTAKKSAFTGWATVVSAEKLEQSQVTSVTDALAGAVPGVTLTSNNGAPGASASIKIRGFSSLNAGNDPLIIVDGAPYSGDLSNINPNDVESMTVLKDAASNALYGARGANGVIIITTKRANMSGEAKVTFDAKWGANTRALKKYDVITDPGMYYEMHYGAMKNYYMNQMGMSGQAAWTEANNNLFGSNGGLGYNVYTIPEGQYLIGQNGKLNPDATLGRVVKYKGRDYLLTPDDWDKVGSRTGLRQEYNFSISAANEKSSFYVSLGYLGNEGITEGSDLKRLTGRLKADYQAKKWLKIGANVGYIHSNRNSNPNMDTSLGASNLMYYTSMMAPIYPVYVRVLDESGNPVIKTDEYGHKAYDYGVAINNYGVGRPFGQTGNPLGSNAYNEVTYIGDQLNGTFTADVNITDFLKANATSTVTWGQTNKSDYQNPYYGSKQGVNGEIFKSATTSMRSNHVQSLTYFQDFAKHSVSVMVGHEYYKTKTTYLDATANGGFSPDIPEINAFATKKDSHSYTTEYNVEGYFGSAQYNYAEKYYASASFRRDASSYFAKENRWGNFWSVGVAWIISKENFMTNYASWLDMLKLKFSVGQQGNDNIGSYAYTDLYSLSKANETTMSPVFYRMGNPDITWETTTNINVGIEFSLWKGRLAGNLDVYTKKTSDLLFWLSVPESAGSRGYYGNVGDIRNTGVELALTGAIIRTRNIDWSVSANISHNKTKILKLPESKIAEAGGFIESNTPRTYQNWFEEGGSLYNAFLPRYAGVNEKGEATYWIDDTLEGATNRPGKELSRTTTSINEASKYALGSTLPKAFGGFSTTLRVGDFDASVSFDYQIGGKVMDIQYQRLMTPSTTASDAGYNIHKDYAKSWTPNNTTSNIPRWQYGDQYTTGMSDRFLTSASYLNFQSFTVGYTLPKNLIKNIGIIRVFVAVENLCFWSARKGLDPRYSYDGNESVSVYSHVRNISGGVQFTF